MLLELSKHKKQDTTRVNLLNKTAHEFHKNNVTLCEKHVNEALLLAKKLHFYKGKAYSLWIKGLLCYKNDKNQSLAYFEQADKIAEVIKDLSNRVLYLTAIGNLKTTKGNSDEGITFHRKALKLAESIDNKNLIAKCKVNIALYNSSKGKIIEAAKEFEIYFLELNSAFCHNINERYPDLTPNERKLCIFMKLNMSNMDIAQITYQSEEALKKSRLRLRRKLNLERKTNLSTFIQSI